MRPRNYTRNQIDFINGTHYSLMATCHNKINNVCTHSSINQLAFDCKKNDLSALIIHSLVWSLFCCFPGKPVILAYPNIWLIRRAAPSHSDKRGCTVLTLTLEASLIDVKT